MGRERGRESFGSWNIWLSAALSGCFFKFMWKKGGQLKKKKKPCAPCVHIGSLYEISPPSWSALSWHHKRYRKQQDVCFDCHKVTGINHQKVKQWCAAAQESHCWALLSCIASAPFAFLVHRMMQKHDSAWTAVADHAAVAWSISKNSFTYLSHLSTFIYPSVNKHTRSWIC